jgi:hypothetical protein
LEYYRDIVNDSFLRRSAQVIQNQNFIYYSSKPKQTPQCHQIKQEIRNTAVSDATAFCITDGTKVPTIQFSILNLPVCFLKHED